MNNARRIAEKYVSMVIKNFKETGKIWEKYNVVHGSIEVNNEYDMPAMLGWSASVFVYCYELLQDKRLGKKTTNSRVKTD